MNSLTSEGRTAVFDITPDDITQLSDIDLRELVGRLCEAEMVAQGLPVAAVTWGGNQTASDGGLDVRVALPSAAHVTGFVPRASSGFQVKKPDMPRSSIISEICPSGRVRPVIQELADASGAYVIISSTGSTSDSALRKRQKAMREAVDGMANADRLATDFYDRTRLATCVRRHPGLIAWVKGRVGRAHVGWQPYGQWSSAAEDAEEQFLIDEKLSLHVGPADGRPERSIVEAIDELRDELIQPGRVVRLVGLSGVGKTRLVQALFDKRVGLRPLPAAMAIYTNMSDEPNPQPIGLASHLIANQLRAVMVVDNCAADLHRRLSSLCNGKSSTVSVITVEYDIRDDQPEGTQVVSLETASQGLIEKLIGRRYPQISTVDLHTIADASGGNARIAVALAESVGRTGAISGLTNDELFQGLFKQRQETNNALLVAAQVCSLVYSFDGETLRGDDAEIPRLASLASQTPEEVHRHVSELIRRGLAQRRGKWRAVLPHAIANRLAARALEDIPYEFVRQQLFAGESDRLARSFSRRLSFLSHHPKAIEIADDWLAVGGLLGDVMTFDTMHHAMFDSIAAVRPEGALIALERAEQKSGGTAMICAKYVPLLRSISYDASLFERSAQMLARVAVRDEGGRQEKAASSTLISLFTICLSGTHASIERRLSVLEDLLGSTEAKARSLALSALQNVLRTSHFSSGYRFDFGARSRDYGFHPRRKEDVTHWYDCALKFIERVAAAKAHLKAELRNLLARNFRELWTLVELRGELERLFAEAAAEGFWREGWIACRRTLRIDVKKAADVYPSLAALEVRMRPATVRERVRACVLCKHSDVLDLDEAEATGDGHMAAMERLEATAVELGKAVGRDASAFEDLLPYLLCGGSRVWAFGQGLAMVCADSSATWVRMINELEKLTEDQRDVQLMRGFLAEVWSKDRNVAQGLLDMALHQSVLQPFLPLLHAAVELDKLGVERLKRGLSANLVPVEACRSLVYGRTTDRLAGEVLKDLIEFIARIPGGFDVALEILSMRLFSDLADKRPHQPELLQAGRDLLPHVKFHRSEGHAGNYYQLDDLARACLAAPEAAPVAGYIATQLRQAVANGETQALYHGDLLSALLLVQPLAVLDALLEDQQIGLTVFEYLADDRLNPADSIPAGVLVSWCEKSPERRFRMAASIVSFAQRQPDGSMQWTGQAKELIAAAPDPRVVLEVLIERFLPSVWSGSRAAVLEKNGRLLDDLSELKSEALTQFVAESRDRVAQQVSNEREREMARDKVRDERFE